jgi:hypothetical protein
MSWWALRLALSSSSGMESLPACASHRKPTREVQSFSTLHNQFDMRLTFTLPLGRSAARARNNS